MQTISSFLNAPAYYLLLEVTMALNEFGEIINTTSHDKINPIFKPLIEHVLQALKQTFGEILHSVYLYGSIAEGRARASLSDADFIVVLNSELEQNENQLDQLASELHAKFSDLVCKIDLPVMVLQELLSPEHRDSGGAYLKILGLPIYGDDLRLDLPEYHPSMALVRAWNSDLGHTITTVLDVLNSNVSDEHKQLKIRAVSAKIIRSFFMIAAAELQIWTTVLSEQTQCVLSHFPDLADILIYMAEAREVQKNSSEFRDSLELFIQIGLPVFESRLSLE